VKKAAVPLAPRPRARGRDREGNELIHQQRERTGDGRPVTAQRWAGSSPPGPAHLWAVSGRGRGI
jgi:hypothetical protein